MSHVLWGLRHGQSQKSRRQSCRFDGSSDGPPRGPKLQQWTSIELVRSHYWTTGSDQSWTQSTPDWGVSLNCGSTQVDDAGEHVPPRVTIRTKWAWVQFPPGIAFECWNWRSKRPLVSLWHSGRESPSGKLLIPNWVWLLIVLNWLVSGVNSRRRFHSWRRM